MTRTDNERASHSELPADDFERGQRENQFPAAAEEGLFPLDDIRAEVPRQNQEVVRLEGVRFGFGNNRDVRTRRETAEFILVHFRDGGQQLFIRQPLINTTDIARKANLKYNWSGITN